jgi:hypothetical protein
MAKKGSILTMEHRKKIRDSIKARWRDPVYRKSISEANKGIAPWSLGKHLSDETRKKIGDANRGRKPWSYGRHLSDETREKISKANKGQVPWSQGKHLSFEARKKISIANKGKPKSEAHRKKLSEHHRDQHGSKHPLWKGGISFEPYCIKFNNEFRERVRAFFGYKCQCCNHQWVIGEPKLAVHHVNYNKKTCCDNSIPLFVPVCRNGCHAKTNHNRQYWEQYFTEMINTYYCGKCYLTKDEMIIIQGTQPNLIIGCVS